MGISKSMERNAEVEAGFGIGVGVYDGAGAYVGAGDGTPSGSNPRGTIIFQLIILIYLIQGVNSLLI